MAWEVAGEEAGEEAGEDLDGVGETMAGDAVVGEVVGAVAVAEEDGLPR